MRSGKNTSPHILNVSANLFGLCFVVFSYLRVNKFSSDTYLDEFSVFSMFVFMLSSGASFLAIRTDGKRSEAYEKFAEYLFITGMIVLFITMLLIVFNAFN